MERVVAKAVELVEAALIDRVVPIDFEQLLRHRRDTVHIVGVKRDDSCSEDIGDVTQRRVLGAFQCQFATQTLFGFDSCLDGSNDQPAAVQCFTKHMQHFGLHLLKDR